MRAAASMKKAKIGLLMAPCRIGSDRRRASNILKSEAMSAMINTPEILLLTTQPAAMKKRAAPVIKEPETWAAQVRSPMPRAASERPQTDPSMINMPRWNLGIERSMRASLSENFLFGIPNIINDNRFLFSQEAMP
jgi:hypothetical protein